MRGAGCTLCIPYTHGVGELGVDLYSLYLIYSGDGAGGAGCRPLYPIYSRCGGLGVDLYSLYLIYSGDGAGGLGVDLYILYTHGVGELGVDLYSLYLIYSGDCGGGGWVSTFVSHILTVGVGGALCMLYSRWGWGGCPLYVILTVQGVSEEARVPRVQYKDGAACPPAVQLHTTLTLSTRLGGFRL